jgi:integrase
LRKIIAVAHELRLYAPGFCKLTRYVPLHPAASGLISDYLDASGHGQDEAGALFRPLHHWRDLTSAKGMTPGAVYDLVRGYSKALGFEIGAHSLRATAATNALDHQADIAKVQEWLGQHCHDPAL